MHVEAKQRALCRRIPVALSQFLCGELLQGIFLQGDATTFGDIMGFPPGCPHSFADVRILVMEPITNVIATDKIKGFLPK
jgi:hypothetical protein